MSNKKYTGLTRRAPSLMALEQRFMFDGAAVDTALDAAKPMADLLHFDVADSALPQAVLTARTDAQVLINAYLTQPNARANLFTIFSGGQTAPSAEWNAAFDQLIANLQNGADAVKVELRSNAELQHALGAFAAQGPDGNPVIYLNAEYAITASADAIKSVLIEELGHSFDAALNGGNDSQGDEGHAFASIVLSGSNNAVLPGTENDLLTLNINGEPVLAEASAPYNIAQTHYIPLPEPDVQTALKAIAGATKVSGDIETVVAITATSSDTVVVYDHWEDGYESDINNPSQGSTKVWTYNSTDGWFNDSDGNGSKNGSETAVSGTGITVNGQSIILRNAVNPASPATVDFDGRDKVGSTKAVSITKAGWSSTPGSVLAGAVAVIDSGNAGTAYTLPVGQNVETVATGTNKLFEYTSANIIATQNGTTVSIDRDGNGTNDLSVTLNEGQTYLVNGGLNAGAKITSDKAIGVYLIAGDVGSAYENRWFALTPDAQWSDSYFAPVGTTLAADPAYVILYNPGSSAITVKWETKTGAQSDITIAANSTGYALMPGSAAHFYTTTGAKFFAVSVIDADATSNATHDWSYSLVPESYLTDKFVVAWGPGNANTDPSTATNGSPVWVTTTANTDLYIDSATVTVKSSSGATISGTRVGSTSTYKYAVTALESYRISDTSDNNQGGLTVYTTDGTLITGAWGEDPSVAGAGNPFLDMGTTVLPYPDYVFTKESAEAKTATYGSGVSDNDDQVELGEEIVYTLNLTNRSVIDLYNINIRDQVTPSAAASYVANSTHITITRADGTVVVNNALIPDATDATPFPLLRADGGYTILDTDTNTAGIQGLERGDQIVITYRIRVGSDATALAALASNGFAVTNDADMSGNGATTPIKLTTNQTLISVNGTDDGLVSLKNSTFTANQSSLQENASLYIEVDDTDANLNTGSVDTLSVTVTNTTTGETEQVTLTETGANTGLFHNTSGLSTSASTGTGNNSGTLNLTGGQSVKVEYVDPKYGSVFDNPTNPGVAGADDNNIATGNANTVTASVVVPSETKVLYLSGTNDLDRIDPAHVSPVDSTTATSAAVTPGGAGGTVYYLDQFGNVAYNNDNSSGVTWTTSWQEDENSDGTTDPTQNASSGNVLITSGALKLVGGTNSDPDVSRSFDLSTADTSQAITLSFNVSADSLGNTSATEKVTLEISTDDGSTFAPITLGSLSNVTGSMEFGGELGNSNALPGAFVGDPGTGTYSADIKSLISSSTAPANIIVRFNANDLSSNSAYLTVDNFKIEFSTGAPAAPVTYTQAIDMATDFAMPSGGEVKIVTHVSSESGLTAGNQAITAALTYETGSSTSILNLTNASYDSNAHTLTWTGTLGSDVSIPAGANVKLVITNNVTGASFKIDYDSNSAPSRIELPTTTVIDIVDVDGIDNNNDGDILDAGEGNNGNGVQEIGFYDKPYSQGGTLINDIGTIDAGGTAYIRVKVRDPFGDYDITGLQLAIDGPGNNAATGDISITLDNTYVVDTNDNGAYKIYEYAWQTINNTGAYSVNVTAKEGYEGSITDTANGSLIVQALDLGTPSITQFITGLSGLVAGSTYNVNDEAFLRITDLDQNTSATSVETVTATVNGITVTLTETGANTGIFEADLSNAATNASPATFTNLQQGTVLSASYTDPDDGSDTSSDGISVPVPANNPPTATNQARTINENATATGTNLITSDEGSGVDSDPNSNPLTVIAVNGSNSAVGATLTLPSGATVTVAANGTYTYNPNGAFNFLAHGESATDSFTYTISDGQGGTATATVTLTINGLANPSVVVTDSNGGTLGDNSIAENASTPVTGSITLAAPAGLQGVNIGGTTITEAQLLALPGTPIPAITTSEGTITITGYTAGTGVVTYSYQQSGTQKDHSAGNTSVVDNIAVSITDDAGTTVLAESIDVLITDTSPAANADAPSVTEGTAASPAANLDGNVLASGTTGDAADTTGADTPVTVTKVIAGNATPTTAVAAGTTRSNGTRVSGSYGTLALGADGSYRYDLDDSNATVDALSSAQSLTDVFSYELTDADGDASITTLTVTINGTNDPLPSFAINDVTVNEAAGTMTFTVTKTGSTNLASSVQYAFADGTAVTTGTSAGDLRDYAGTAGTLNFAAGDTTKTITVTINNDGVYEGSEAFNVNLSNASGATISDASGTGTIKDDGTGNSANGGSGTGTDDDRPLSVNDIRVNEGSPYAVFTVTGKEGQQVKLNLSNGTATIENGNGTVLTDGSEDFGPALQYWNGSAWTNYTANSFITIPSDGDGTASETAKLLVRTAVNPDGLDEGDHTFTLTATNTGGSADTGTATIDDHGGGVKYPDAAPSDPTSTDPGPGTDNTNLDDDRTITVAGGTYNENSPRAVFTVNAYAGQVLTLDVQNAAQSGRAPTGDNEGKPNDSLDTADIYYSLDGGATWHLYTGPITAGSVPVLVAVDITNERDNVYEGEEQLKLVVISGGQSASGYSSIFDDGTGTVTQAITQSTTNNTGANDPSVVKDDDRPKAALPPQLPPVAPAPLNVAEPAPVLPALQPAPAFNSELAPIAPALKPIEPPQPLEANLTSAGGPQFVASESAPPGLSLFAGVTDQFIQTTDAATKISLPYDAFIHSSKDAVIKLQAKQADDSPLPKWVEFDAAAGTFTVKPPKDFKGKLDLKVIARDDEGREAVAIFQMFVGEQDQNTTKPQSRSSFTEKLRMAGKRPVSLVRVAEGAHKVRAG